MTEITMPRLSDSMEEGTILAWLKRDGDRVAIQDELVEIETDKATMTYQAESEGILAIVAQQGDTLPVGAVIARLDVVAERPEGDANENAAPPAGADAPVTDLAASSLVPDLEPPVPAGNGNGAMPTRIRATPLARRLAGAHDVDLARLAGSGPNGRITRSDVVAVLGPTEPSVIPRLPTAERRPVRPVAPPTPTVAPPASSPGDSPKGAPEIVPLTRLQQVVARRIAATKATVPEFQVEAEAGMDAAVALRGEMKRAVADMGRAVPSLNDLIVKASALALREHPRANGSYGDGGFELYPRVNVGVAVAADDSLVVPTVFDADQKSLGAIAETTRSLAARVRDASITPAELSGATFTVSNLGMYGMTAISPIINSPQAAILGAGALRVVPALVEGELVERRVMTLTLTCDHRILYGADAARFLSTIRGLLESPLRLVL
jgi:pyruvate dehydrogenase E2 component (dihydrolipoamide acetyltransferase)